jgi:GGDEF domain-containing protein
MSFGLDSAFPSAVRFRPTVRQPHAWRRARAVLSWLGILAVKPVRIAARTTNDERVPPHDRQSMFRAADEMFRRSGRDGQPLTLTVIVFDLGDLPELEVTFGAQVVVEVVEKMSRKFQCLATRGGVAVRTDATEFTLLLPPAGRDKALEAIHASLSQPCRFELAVDGHKIVMVPEFAFRTLVGATVSIENAHEGLRQEIAQTQLEAQRRRKSLKDRERHSRPTELQVPAPMLVRAPLPVHSDAEVRTGGVENKRVPQKAPELRYPPSPATIPMPMGLH